MDVNAVEYFADGDFAGSLVKRIVYRAELNKLEFVLLYMGFVPALARPLDGPTFQQPWDFRRLLFEKVTQLERTNCRFKVGFQGFDPAIFNFPETMIATVTVEAASVRKIVDARRTITCYRAGISMGSLGAYDFNFGSLSADQRLVKTVPLPGDKYSQVDYYTGERVDSHDPFSVR